MSIILAAIIIFMAKLASMESDKTIPKLVFAASILSQFLLPDICKSWAKGTFVFHTTALITATIALYLFMRRQAKKQPAATPANIFVLLTHQTGVVMLISTVLDIAIKIGGQL